MLDDVDFYIKNGVPCPKDKLLEFKKAVKETKIRALRPEKIYGEMWLQFFQNFLREALQRLARNIIMCIMCRHKDSMCKLSKKYDTSQDCFAFQRRILS